MIPNLLLVSISLKMEDKCTHTQCTVLIFNLFLQAYSDTLLICTRGEKGISLCEIAVVVDPSNQQKLGVWSTAKTINPYANFRGVGGRAVLSNT